MFLTLYDTVCAKSHDKTNTISQLLKLNFVANFSLSIPSSFLILHDYSIKLQIHKKNYGENINIKKYTPRLVHASRIS